MNAQTFTYEFEILSWTPEVSPTNLGSEIPTADLMTAHVEEERRHRVNARVQQRMQESDVERRIQKRQRELLQEMRQQAVLRAQGHNEVPEQTAHQALIDKVRRLYC